ncbi:hypothetical protein B0H13DRAFT_2275353 [Mycena leptocephala]|nr:hypothetical protein B0H13DRAFT_2275353 [Mycena leptocephala]
MRQPFCRQTLVSTPIDSKVGTNGIARDAEGCVQIIDLIRVTSTSLLAVYFDLLGIRTKPYKSSEPLMYPSRPKLPDVTQFGKWQHSYSGLRALTTSQRDPQPINPTKTCLKLISIKSTTEDITERRAADFRRRRRNDWRLTNLQLAGNRWTGWDSNDVGERRPWPEDVSGWNDYGLDFDTTVPAAISPVDLDQLQREMLRLPNVRRRLAAWRLALLRERKATTHQLTLAAFAPSPVRRIPADVLLEIFKVLKSIVKTPKTQNDDGKVTESPEVHFVGHDVGTILSKGSADLVEVYLERSRSRPLTIEINTQTYTQGRSSQRAIDLLADHLLELRVFMGLRIGDAIPALPSFQPLRGNLPYLEVLQIPVWSSLANEFEFVPRLHTLRLCGLQELTQADHKFDRTQIRSLTLRDASGHQLLQYPNVADLTCVESSAERLHQSIPTATAPVLTGLKAWKIEFTRDEKATFGGYDAWGISNIFRRFNMPALHSLDVQFRLPPSFPLQAQDIGFTGLQHPDWGTPSDPRAHS